MVVWKITEKPAELLQILGSQLTDHGLSQPDRLHWLASRAILSSLFPNQRIDLHKDERNKPELIVDEKVHAVSITHSHDYAAVIVCKHRAVAVDLERIDERIIRVMSKFISDEEEIQDNEHPELYYTMVWSAKETLYKYYAKKELDFKQNLHILPFKTTDKILMGKISKDVFTLQLPVHVKQIENYVLTYAFGIG